MWLLKVLLYKLSSSKYSDPFVFHQQTLCPQTRRVKIVTVKRHLKFFSASAFNECITHTQNTKQSLNNKNIINIDLK